MELNRLRTGELLAGGAAGLLALTMFLPWYAGQPPVVATATPVDPTLSAWQAFAVVDIVMALTILAALGLAALAATRASVALPVAGGVLLTTLAVLTTLFVLYRLLDEPRSDPYLEIEPAALLGLVLCAAIAFGGFLSMRDEGTNHAAAGPPGAGNGADDIPVLPAPPAGPASAGEGGVR